LRRKLCNAVLNEPGAAGDDIEQSLNRGGNFLPRESYLKQIVEVFRRIEAG
jgi:hypothetical protein